MTTNDPELLRWWNELDETGRLVWLAWSRSASPEKAFKCYRDVLEAAESAKAAERTHQAVTEAARAAALDAAGRVGTNGVGTQH